MALLQKKSEAIRLREAGSSYSQIKEQLNVSKSTLSLWLRDMPLDEKRLRGLRDFSAVRIEKFRESMRRKREARLATVRTQVAEDIGCLSQRELLLAGLFLYWGEGTKTAVANTSVSNTDPVMLNFFIEWLEVLGVPKKKLRIYVHLYADMDVKKELKYWSKTLGLPLSAFRKPYIKDSKRSGLSYPQRFTHGTCNVIYNNRDVSEYVMSALDYIREEFALKQGV
ncbi:MAG: hypothetical protein WC030_03230 [Candidatus Paceibacterota bacterium]